MPLKTRKKTPAPPPIPRLVQWISVRDHLPEDDTDVLVSSLGRNVEVRLAYRAEGFWRETVSNCLIVDSTHWMFLPDPPGWEGA